MLREGLSNDEAQNSNDHFEHTWTGQTYPYHKNVMSPENLGMSPEGSMDAMVKNIAGLVNYGQILITGAGHANAKINREGRDEALGDKFFLKTMGKCYPVKTSEDTKRPLTAFYNDAGMVGVESVDSCGDRAKYLKDGERCDFVYYKKESEGNEGNDETLEVWAGDGERAKRNRYVYIDNLPTGKIPGLGALHGMRGLIPAMIENLGHFNPMKLMDSISAPAIPGCVKLNMETIKFNGNSNQESNWHHEYTRDTHYVAVNDVAELYPCSFKADGGTSKNPISGLSMNNCPKHATETFANLFDKNNKNKEKQLLNLKNKPIAKLFNVSFGVLLAYLLWKVLRKEMKI